MGPSSKHFSELCRGGVSMAIGGIFLLGCSRGSWSAGPSFRLPAYPGLPLQERPESARAGTKSAVEVSPAPILAPSAPRPVRAFGKVEIPYKLGERRHFRSQAEYASSIRDRRRWNRGGVGSTRSSIPSMSGHPKPRVVVNIESLMGGHSRKKLLRHARRYHWKAAIDCYRLGFQDDPFLRGWTYAQVKVAASGVVRSSALRSTTLKDERVAACLVEKLKNLRFPRGNRGSVVRFAMRVAPGDEPVPPPDAAIVPGQGVLDRDAVRLSFIEAMPQIMACYRAAFVYAPELWGRIIIRVWLDDYGRVKGAYEQGSHFPAPRVTQCILRHIRKMKFKRPVGGAVRILVPLRLWNERSEGLKKVPTTER